MSIPWGTPFGYPQSRTPKPTWNEWRFWRSAKRDIENQWIFFRLSPLTFTTLPADNSTLYPKLVPCGSHLAVIAQFKETSQKWIICRVWVKKHWEQINDPSTGKHYSLTFLPATPSFPLRTLEGLFELTWRHSRALNLPRALLPKLQRYKDTVRCAALGAEVPGHRQQQLTQTLIVRLLKTHFL